MLRRIFVPKREEVVGNWRRLYNEVKGKGKGKGAPVL
jgi:hypothetical protein